MSFASLRRLACISIATVLAFTTTVSAQSDNRLEQIKRLNRVAAQKAEADIRDLIKEAATLIKTDPSTALEVLESSIRTANEDTALSEAQRDSLKRLAKAHIRDAKAAGGKIDVKEKDTAVRKDAARTRPDDEGSQRTREIADRLNRTRESLRETKELRNNQSRGLSAAERDVGNSATPAGKDMEFPKNWPELVAKRSGGQQMTKAEKALMKALDSSIDANFDNIRFEDVIKYLEDKAGITILMDKLALEQQAVTYETTVKFRARKVSLRTVLRRVLADHGLTYYIKDEAIQVTTPDKAREVTSVRSYYIGDIVSRINFDLGPVLNQQQVVDNAKRIIDMIQSQVEPDSWQINKGNGTIFFEPTRMVLVVKATAEVHYMLGGGMK
jgi:hypothetical protein